MAFRGTMGGLRIFKLGVSHVTCFSIIGGSDAQVKSGLEEPIHCTLRVSSKAPGTGVPQRSSYHTSGRMSSHLEQSQLLNECKGPM